MIDLNRLENGHLKMMIINPTKSKAICFTKTRVMELLSVREIVIPKLGRCKYLGTIFSANQVELIK
jgi:hypothetical protein